MNYPRLREDHEGVSSVRRSGPSSRSHDSVDELISHLVDKGNRFLTLSVDLLLISDFDYSFRWVNPACEPILGYTREEFLGRPYLEFVHPDDLERTRSLADSIAGSGDGVADFENRYRAKDGSYRWLLWSATPDLRERLIYAVAKDVTARKETESILQRREAQLAEAQQVAHVGSWFWDIPERRLEWSDELYRIYGLEPHESVPDTKLYLERVHPDDRERVRATVASAVRDRRDFSFQERIVRPGGEVRTLLTKGRIGLADGGEPLRILGTSQDITGSERAKAALAEAEERFRNAFDNAPTGMALVSVDPKTGGQLLRVNEALCSIVGYTGDELVGRDVQAITHPEDVDADVRLLRRLLSGDISNYEVEKRYIHADGHVVWALVRGSIVRDSAGRPLYGVGQMQDVTERKRFEEQLAHQALHDPLTGLPNRTLALDRLGQALARAGRSGSTVAVLFIDLDHFKVVNDSLGHHVGDHLLIAVARRLRKVLRSTDTVARLGGDEYLMVCDELPGAQEAIRMTERVEGALARPIELEGEEQVVTASIGVAIADAPDQEAEALVRDADAAMYRAKELGRARYEVFDQAMRSRAVSRLMTERALHRALQQDEFRIHYQPVVSLATGAIVEIEALLRWERPEQGVVGPAEFIAVAEETGQIVSIGTWVLREVSSVAASWRRAYGHRAPFPVYVNIAGRQLTSGLPDLVSQILLDTDLPPGHIGLEITEGGLMEDLQPPATVLGKLKGLGVHIRLDDFGTGYSSLSHLGRLPIDGLKIDRSFVAGLERGTGDSAIVSTVAAMGKALGLTVVAEGVETAEQEAAVRELGCDFAQGFYFARPMPREEIEQLFAPSMTDPRD